MNINPSNKEERGDLYPFASVVQGGNHHLMDTRTGGELQGYPDYQTMQEDADMLNGAGYALPPDLKLRYDDCAAGVAIRNHNTEVQHA